MPLETSPERPAPVRTVARLLGEWVGRLGKVWVEGQVTQLTSRAGTGTAFLTLRDPAADVSLNVTCRRDLLATLDPPLSQGVRVVVLGKPELYVPRGSLSLVATDIRHVGVGELLARLQRLRQVLAAEGLFAAERKRPLPFLPRTVGLVTGRGSAAEHDVLEVARARWPAVRFRVANVAVQGVSAVPQVLAALQALDRDPEVDVIVVARGGGSVEDLLPFSDESLCRAVAACRTPVVSAIGHETDTPLLDLVADVRAATPTDAARRVVPDAAGESAAVTGLRTRARATLVRRLDRERQVVTALRSRRALADPATVLAGHREAVVGLRGRATGVLRHRVAAATTDVGHARARVRALSPAATLARGYAIVLREDGHVVRRVAETAVAARLTVRLADGALGVRVTELRGTELRGTDPPRSEEGRRG